MKLWVLIVVLAGLLAACDRNVRQRHGANEGDAMQSAAGGSANEGKAARRAAGR